MNRRTWLTAIMALPLVRWFQPQRQQLPAPSYKKGDNVPSWIIATTGGPCTKFGCDVNVEPLSTFTSTLTAIPGTGDTVFQAFGGEHHILLPFTSINFPKGMVCAETMKARTT